MKILVSIVLFLFVSFLAAPTVVSMLEDDVDISMVYSLTEEEIQKEINEVKAGPQSEFSFSFLTIIKKASVIQSKYLLWHDNVSGDIFLPPPELI